MRQLMVGLALLAAACGDVGIEPPVAAAADSADQIMEGMAFSVTLDGVKLSHVEADSAWVYQARQINELKKLRVTFFDRANGKEMSVVTADSGTFNQRDGTLDARGSVVATSTNGGILKSEHLVYDKFQNEIYSDTAFTFTSPEGNSSGAAFVSDPDFKRVRAQRPGGRMRGKGFLLPGQDTSKGAPR